MTDFPNIIEIYVAESADNNPIIGIILTIHLYASIKNDYYFITSFSDADGKIVITKEELSAFIDDSIGRYIMDYASNLQNCKPFIEIIMEGKISLKNRKERLIKMKSYSEDADKNIEIINRCSNWLYEEAKQVIEIIQGAKKQTVNLRIRKI